MQQLEPTYLRYVYDGLSKGSISSNNAAGLPFGFIGLFEKEFQANIPSNERSKLLRRLGVWALFKGAVSVEMGWFCIDLFPKNEILKKIDTLIFDFSDNTTILLETCYLLIKIKEKKRAFILANSIPERIMVDPFIFEDLKQERLAQVALFLNKNGDSDKNETIDDPYNYHDYLNIDRDTNGFFDEIFDNNQDYTFIISNLNSPEFYPVFLNHKAKMACFFENKIDQNKINLLSEVINISEWKRISNQINLN